jgi:hypothetical protein
MELESIATKGVSFIRVSTALCDKFELRKVTNFSGYSANASPIISGVRVARSLVSV